MTNVPDDLKYTKNDEWARMHGKTVKVGITDFAQDQLTDIVFIGFPGKERDLPKVGDMVKAGDQVAILESVKSTAPVYSPVSGKLVKAHMELDPDTGGDPRMINTDPYGEGWLVEIEMSEPNPALLSAADYKAHIATKKH